MATLWLESCEDDASVPLFGRFVDPSSKSSNSSGDEEGEELECERGMRGLFLESVGGGE